MRSYAWVELQRGLLDFDRRRDHEALAHYRVAERAYSGYWLIEEHIAEALDRLGRTAQAVEMYQRVIERTRNPEFVSALTDQIPFYAQRHVVKPGLTGWSQVRYTYGANVEESIKKLEYDLYYVKNHTLLLDILILFKTVRVVMLGEGAR